VFWFWLLVTPALLMAILGLRGERARVNYVSRRLAESPAAFPPASVIVPVKGEDQDLRKNLAALASLDYPDYELIIVAHTAADIPPGVLPRRAKIVFAHGSDPNTSEKIQNLQAAVRATCKRSEIFAFADSDGRPTRRWLQSLVAPLTEKGIGASTGYRWFVPQPPTFWSLMRGVWDSVALGMLGPGNNGFAWGGAMAIQKETFYQARVSEYWKNTISDDYALSAAVHATGLSIAYAPGALTPCTERLVCIPFFSWIRRQMTITRVYNPRMWWPAIVAHLFYCAAMLASCIVLARGYRLAGVALATQLIPGMWKGFNRGRLARAALPEYAGWFRRYGFVHTLFVPIATWVWLVALITSAFGNTIHWRGHSYTLRRPGEKAAQ
jgi:ceramide glucosyltransferase